MHMERLHVAPAIQSASDTQGNVHFAYFRLHRWVPQAESLWQGSAMGPGTESCGSGGGSSTRAR
jgi:hypothetical protein